MKKKEIKQLEDKDLEVLEEEADIFFGDGKEVDDVGINERE